MLLPEYSYAGRGGLALNDRKPGSYCTFDVFRLGPRFSIWMPNEKSFTGLTPGPNASTLPAHLQVCQLLDSNQQHLRPETESSASVLFTWDLFTRRFPESLQLVQSRFRETSSPTLPVVLFQIDNVHILGSMRDFYHLRLVYRQVFA